MAHVTVSPSARADLTKIADDILANNGALVASRIIGSMHRSFEYLARYPRVGRPRPRLGDGLRSWPVSSYIALYRYRTGGIEIVRVIHGKRRLTRTLVEPIT